MSVSMLVSLSMSVAIGQLNEEYNGWIPKNLRESVFRGREIKGYERTELFQGSDGRLTHVSQNVAPGRHPFGHANRGFPWGHTAGISDFTTNAKVLTFISKPQDKKILVWREDLPRYFQNEGSYLAWAYPKDTILIEVLLVEDKNGADRAFEVRTRRRVTEKIGTGIRSNVPIESNWEPKVYIPNLNIEKMFPNAVGPEKMYGIQGFRIDSKIKLKALGEIDPKVLDGVDFIEGKNRYIGRAGTHTLVPMGYFGTGIGASCATCHSQTLMAARHIDPQQDWYGKVRGSDEIFSFPMYHPSNRNQFQPDQRLVEMRWVEFVK